MLLPSAGFTSAYKKIVQNALDSDSSIIIFVACECDALCSCKIFTSLLQTDGVAYTIKQVLGYDDIKQANEKLIADNDDLRSVIFINCGSTIDLNEIITIHENLTCYIFDSHRPINIQNINNKNIVVLVDDTFSRDSVPQLLTAEEEALLRKDEEDSQSEDDYQDEEEDSESEGRQLKRRLREEKNERMLKKIKLDQYYKGGHYEIPTSYFIYKLSFQLNYDSNDLLWMAIVGVTYYYINNLITEENYQYLANFLKPTEENRIEEDNKQKQQLITSGAILPIREPHLMLYRHWSLYNSFYYSNYVAVKLKTWNLTGVKKLDEMFAKMGLPLKEAKEKFVFFKKKKELFSLCEEYLPQYGIDHFFYDSFKRYYNFKHEFSASDIVYSISAILERRALNEEEEEWKTNWLAAYDALSRNAEEEVLMKGIQLAKEQQEAIMRLGIDIINKKLIHVTSFFRYAYVRDLSEEDVNMFTKPILLRRLATFIVNVHKQQNKWIGEKKSKPFILGILNPATNYYTLLGLQCTKYGEGDMNVFTLFFKEVSNMIPSKNKLESFNGTILEVNKEDGDLFIELLHMQMARSNEELTFSTSL